MNENTRGLTFLFPYIDDLLVASSPITGARRPTPSSLPLSVRGILIILTNNELGAFTLV